MTEEYPEYGSTDAMGYRLVAVWLRKAMDSSTINGSTVILKDNSGTLVAGSVSYSVVTKCGWPFPCYDVYYLFFYPSSPLAPGTHYTFTITSDVHYDTGNALEHDISYSFTTRPDLGTGIWEKMSTADAPSWSIGDTAIWTGTEMIVWGKLGGGQYDPAADEWQPISSLNSPSARTGHTAVWTGSEMIVWGGKDDAGTILNEGGRYDPATDSWTSLSASGAPSARTGHTAVWTGSEMIVWGGYNYATDPITGLPTSFAKNTGGRYNPATNTWQTMTTNNAPPRRMNHTAVWTGSRMIVWAGYGGEALPLDYTVLQDGAAYDPANDTWITVASDGAPSARDGHTAVWTGSEMIVWGGGNYFYDYYNTGGIYNPTTDSWRETSTIGAPEERRYYRAIWTGTEMIVWGGEIEIEIFLNFYKAVNLHTGGSYDADTDNWQQTSTTGAPLGKSHHVAVWTGTEMIVWNGTGSKYLP